MTAHSACAPSEVLPAGPSGHWLAQTARRALPAGGHKPGDTGFATCALSSDCEAAAVARHFTRTTLQAWGMAPLIDDVAVVVTELLSNALRHGLAGPDGPPAPLGLVGLGLLRRGSTVLCAVSDPGTRVPVVREPDDLAESGRGLHIIDALSDSWGWTPPNRAGKSVWALLSTTGGATAGRH